MKLNAVRIVEFTNPSGATVFRVDGKDKSGQRVRENHKTLAEAQNRKTELENEIANLPTMPLVATRLTPEQVADAELAFKSILHGGSLIGAVNFFNENFRQAVNPMALRPALVKFIAEKRAANARPLTIRNLETRVGFLVDKMPEKLCSDVLPDHIKEIVNRPGRSPVTAGNDRRALSSFFNWCLRQKYCPSNPVEAVEVPEIDETEPVIMPLDDCRRFIAAAASYKDGVVLPYTALALFCAIRPTELSRLNWNAINLDTREITISGEIAKMRGRRVVGISETCAKLLAEHALKRTPLVGVNWRRDFDAVKLAAGYGTPDPKDEKRAHLKPWVPDILRHTGISHHFQKHAHEGLTAKWAGNSPDMIHGHYKGLVSEADTEAFWKLGTNAENIIKLERAA
jgi:integrase